MKLRGAWQSLGLNPGNIAGHPQLNPAHLPDYGISLTLQEIETGMEVVENILKDHHMEIIVLCIPCGNKHYLKSRMPTIPILAFDLSPYHDTL